MMAAESTKFVYACGGGTADGRAGMKALLGGKGANLAEMANLGLPVPPGFTITTEVCTAFYAGGRHYPDDLETQVKRALAKVESLADCRFGDPANPLLVSVRSGARASMPGMMDTVLNLGLNDTTVEGLAAESGDRRFAYDSYRRFISMYSDVVLGVDHAGGDVAALRIDALDARRNRDSAPGGNDLTAAHDDGAALDRRAAVADDEFRVGERDILRGGGCGKRQDRG